MNSSELDIVVKLKDEATAGMQKLAKEANSMGDSFKLTGMKSLSLGTDVTGLTKVLAGTAVAVGGLAVAFGISSVKAYEDAQVAIARVDATLNSMGKNAKANRDAILDAANAAVKLGFDDEAAAESITRFYQATGNLAQATKLNNIAMDLARAKHLDLATAANLVNQVLSGNGRVLKQYQINLKDAATPLEALGELQEKVSGQAGAFAGTFEGQMQVLSVSFQNIKEEIGKVLVDALTPFVQEFTAWLLDPKTQQSMKQWTADFKSWAEVIIPVLIDVFKMWLDVIKDIFNYMEKVGESITTAITRAATLVSQIGSGNLSGAAATFFSTAGASAATQRLYGKASGGPVSGGMPYIVGEKGPEIFMPSSSGSIIPNGQGIGGGGISVVISGNFYGTDQSAAEKFGDMIANIIGQQLKIRTI